jgi:hypothetical protein
MAAVKFDKITEFLGHTGVEKLSVKKFVESNDMQAT